MPSLGSTQPFLLSPPTTHSVTEAVPFTENNTTAAAITYTNQRTNPSNIRSFLQSYINFIKQYHPQLHLVEDTVSRLLIYAPQRFVTTSSSSSSTGDVGGWLHIEVLYATLNTISLLNDAIYDGWGDGNGMTVGTWKEVNNDSEGREGGRCGGGVVEKGEEEEVDFLDPNSSNDDGWRHRCSVAKIGGAHCNSPLRDFLKQSLLQSKRLHHLLSHYSIPLLRSTLALISCIAPALEVTAGSTFAAAPALPPGAELSSVTRTMYEQHHQKQRIKRIVMIECWKFICRLLLLGINGRKEYNRLQQQNQKDCKYREKRCAAADLRICAMGILSQNGTLTPGEISIPTHEEVERLRKVTYVGRRTGRKCSSSERLSAEPSSSVRQQQQSNSSKQQPSPYLRLCLRLMGEFLHIYRPLFWSNAEQREAAASSSATQLSNGGTYNTTGKQKKWKRLKSWFISLTMDILSNELTMLSMHEQNDSYYQQTSSFQSRRRDKQHRNNLPAATATQMELQRRKVRWILYMLRSPIWDIITQPSLNTLTNGMVRYIPLVGKLIGIYMRDVVSYWQEHHFMLEG